MKKSYLKVKVISLSLSFFLTFVVFFMYGNSTKSVLASTPETQKDESVFDSSNYETVLSYEKIFQVYYRQTVEAMAEYNIEMPYSYEEFCDGYYKFDTNLNSYCDFLVAEANGTICMADYEVSQISFSEDADYIIKGDTANRESPNFNPEITPSSALQRDIYYTKGFDYSSIQNGDIIVETNTKFNNMGHSGFVYNINKPVSGRIHGRSTYIQIIEAVRGGVQFGVLDDNRMAEYAVVIIRPTNTGLSVVEDARYFHWRQLGRSYYLPLENGDAHTDINSETWYCSELNYAAYYYARRIIARPSSGGWVWPMDLLNSNATDYVSFSKTLDARLLGKENGKWKIRVYNNTGSAVGLYYNAKLAFYDDAKKWVGLRDVNTTPVTIANFSYADILIGTNIFATTAAMSYKIGNKRYITYCNELNNNTRRMSIYKNVV